MAAIVKANASPAMRQSWALRRRTRKCSRIAGSDAAGAAIQPPARAAAKSGPRTSIPARNHADRDSHPRPTSAGTTKAVTSQSASAGTPNRISESLTPTRSGIRGRGSASMSASRGSTWPLSRTSDSHSSMRESRPQLGAARGASACAFDRRSPTSRHRGNWHRGARVLLPLYPQM
jgi:hypothetical protein